ncbi:MAG: hypothetical protein AAF639_29255 [Chloroflexota bacterium]
MTLLHCTPSTHHWPNVPQQGFSLFPVIDAESGALWARWLALRGIDTPSHRPPRVDHNPRTSTQWRPRQPRNHNHCYIITATADTNTARAALALAPLRHWTITACGIPSCAIFVSSIFVVE